MQLINTKNRGGKSGREILRRNKNPLGKSKKIINLISMTVDELIRQCHMSLSAIGMLHLKFKSRTTLEPYPGNQIAMIGEL